MSVIGLILDSKERRYYEKCQQHRSLHHATVQRLDGVPAVRDGRGLARGSRGQPRGIHLPVTPEGPCPLALRLAR